MAGPEDKKPEEWGEVFASKRRTYFGYTEALESLFRQLLEKDGIPYVQIEGRTKEVPNFVAKLRRKPYEKPLEEVMDFSGIRIVLYYLDDVERVGELIAQQFSVDQRNSVDKGAFLDPDRFGYLSVHYVVQPSESRKVLPEWSEFSDLWAEIQVRTVLQHAWGAISRKLAYASVREAPRDLQRSLNRLSALLELADEQFLDIREARAEIEQQYDREVERGNLDLAVDESSVEIYLRESGVADRLARLAEEAGSSSMSSFDVTEEDEQEEMRDLLTVLDLLGIARIFELDEWVANLWDDMPGFMQWVNEGYQDSDGDPLWASPKNWLALALLWSSKPPPQHFSEVNYVEELIDLIVSGYDAEPS